MIKRTRCREKIIEPGIEIVTALVREFKANPNGAKYKCIWMDGVLMDDEITAANRFLPRGL